VIAYSHWAGISGLFANGSSGLQAVTVRPAFLDLASTDKSMLALAVPPNASVAPAAQGLRMCGELLTRVERIGNWTGHGRQIASCAHKMESRGRLFHLGNQGTADHDLWQPFGEFEDVVSHPVRRLHI
jgi:hypothetical protein